MPSGHAEEGGGVPDMALVNVLTGAGVAGVFCLLFILGFVYPRSVVSDQKQEIAELKEALQSERDRANTAVAAATATRDVLAAIQLGQHMGAPARTDLDR